MTSMVLAVFSLSLIAIVLAEVWKLLLVVAAFAILLWMVRMGLHAGSAAMTQSKARRDDILRRADQQHRWIMDGHVEKGTFGQYMPPKGLRQTGPTVGGQLGM